MNIDEFVTKEQFDEFRNVDNFDNNTILKKRWNKVDDLLSAFYSKNQKINRKIYDNLQSIFDGIKFTYEEINDYASNSEISRLRNRIEDLKDEYGLQGYIGYQLNNYSRRKRLRNKDILLGYIMVEYYRQYQEQNKEEIILFDEIKNVVYTQVYEETVIAIEPDKKKRKKKIRLLTVPEAFLLQLIAMSEYNGFKWIDYKEGNIGYNSRKLYETITLLMQQGKELIVGGYVISSLLKKQERAYLNYHLLEKETENYHNVFSGAIDNFISTVVNRISLKAMKDAGCTMVQFIATVDDKTTKMCISLNLKVFYIDEINKYKRYSDEDKKEIVYTTMGLETGANLPPINNHFHYCRSTIIPFK